MFKHCYFVTSIHVFNDEGFFWNARKLAFDPHRQIIGVKPCRTAKFVPWQKIKENIDATGSETGYLVEQYHQKIIVWNIKTEIVQAGFPIAAITVSPRGYQFNNKKMPTGLVQTLFDQLKTKSYFNWLPKNTAIMPACELFFYTKNVAAAFFSVEHAITIFVREHQNWHAHKLSCDDLIEGVVATTIKKQKLLLVLKTKETPPIPKSNAKQLTQAYSFNVKTKKTKVMPKTITRLIT